MLAAQAPIEGVPFEHPPPDPPEEVVTPDHPPPLTEKSPLTNMLIGSAFVVFNGENIAIKAAMNRIQDPFRGFILIFPPAAANKNSNEQKLFQILKGLPNIVRKPFYIHFLIELCHTIKNLFYSLHPKNETHPLTLLVLNRMNHIRFLISKLI